MLFGVIKNSVGLFSLFAEFLREGDKNRVGDASLTHVLCVFVSMYLFVCVGVLCACVNASESGRDSK